MKPGICIILSVFCLLKSEAQHIISTESYRFRPEEKSIRVFYENDLFTRTDRYYSQGVLLEFIHPSIIKSPVSKILFKPSGSSLRSGITAEINAFTPDDIGAQDIQYGDQPFSATFFVRQFEITSDSVHKWQFVSSAGIGIIGPASLGEEIQVGLHRATNSTIPEGWANQVASDVLVNYSVSYSRTLLDVARSIRLNGDVSVTVGSPFTNGAVGLTVLAGWMDPAFSGVPKAPFRFHLFYQPRLVAVGYDATLQGGLFNSNSRYFFQASAIQRVVYTQSAGIILNFRKLSIEYSLSLETPRFRNGFSHRYGSIHLGFYL